MSDNVKIDVLLVGAGYMAIEYGKVLKGLNRNFITVGRGEESAKKFEQATGFYAQRGGLEKFIAESDSLPDYAIIAVGVNELASTCAAALKCGVKKILLEKPAALSVKDFEMLRNMAKENSATISIAYNRRFYSSTRTAAKYILEDGGITSFNFEFTEWLHLFNKDALEDMNALETLNLPNIFLGNSSHVMDMAFFLGGKPKEISCYRAGATPTKKYYTTFAGAGLTNDDVPFSYQANWLSAGRWGVEVMTRRHRFIFRPLEKLQVQNLKSVKTEFVDIDDSLDTLYKPGVFLETQAFLEQNENFKYLCTLEEQYQMLPFYQKISGNNFD